MINLLLAAILVVVLVSWRRIFRALRWAASAAIRIYHHATDHVYERTTVVEELVPVLESMFEDKTLHFSYRMTRVDNAMGGLNYTTGGLKRMLRTARGNLWELERYYNAIKWTLDGYSEFGVLPGAREPRYAEVLPIFRDAYERAKANVEYRRAHARSSREIDVAGRQVLLAGLSAFSAVAAAIAAGFSAYAAMGELRADPPLKCTPSVQATASAPERR